MNTKNLPKPDADFRKLRREELLEIYGGFYKGPISPYVWVKYLIDTVRKEKD